MGVHRGLGNLLDSRSLSMFSFKRMDQLSINLFQFSFVHWKKELPNLENDS